MAYTVLALKWRPKNFDEVVGQGHVTATLKNAVAGNRLAHAYLFAGPRGVGKTSTARIFAKALNCKNGPTAEPCQVCPSCLEIAQGRSLDVLEIDGASNRGIDEIRTLRENVKFSPTQGKFKIYIIDEVHMLTSEAFNALLKTLEEPPEFVKFIFATTQAHKVPATILSRCQRFDFLRIPLMKITEQIGKIAAAEKIDINQDVLFSIARACDGSLRDAESILDQLATFSKDKISSDDINSVLGIVEEDVLLAIADKIIHKDSQGALNLFNEIIERGKDTNVFLTNLIEHFRNLMIAKVAKVDAALIDLPADIREKILQQSNAFSLEEIFTAFNLLINAQEMLRRFDSSRIPLEIALVKLTQDKRKTSINTYVSDSPKPQAAVQEAPQNIQPESQPHIPIDEVKNSWHAVIEQLGKVKISLASYLGEGEPIRVDKNSVGISFPKNLSLHKEALERKENRAIIEKTLSQVFNKDLRAHFILSQEAQVKKDSIDSPIVRQALDAFGGRIVREE